MKKVEPITKPCLHCNKDYTLPAWRSKRTKFCSVKCSIEYNTLNGLNPGQFKKGKKAYNKGIPSNPESVEKMRQSKIGKPSKKKGTNVPRDIVEKAKIARLNGKGFTRTEEQNKRLSAYLQGVSLEEWNGFASSERQTNWNSKESKEWRNSVFIRDNFTCQECGDHNYKGRGKSIRVEAHHIKEWVNYPELRLDINNGITLCTKCHNKTKKGGVTKIKKAA